MNFIKVAIERNNKKNKETKMRNYEENICHEIHTVDLLINNLNSALANVMFPYFSNVQDDFEKLKKSLRESVRMTSFICIPLMAGLIACADNFIKIVLTENWIESVPFLQSNLRCIFLFHLRLYL